MTRLVCGNVRGAVNDIGIWYSCKYRNQKQRFFGDNKVLFDSIYRYVDYDRLDELFVTRFPYAHNMEQAFYNVAHGEARVIIENTYARQQMCFPIIARPFPYNKKYIDIVFRNVVILTNVLILEQSPLRL